MNCKPNSMAMIVRDCGDKDVAKMLGRTMTVLDISHVDTEVGPIWNLETPIEFENGETFTQCGDMILMMIDQPAPGLPAVDKIIELENV